MARRVASWTLRRLAGLAYLVTLLAAGTAVAGPLAPVLAPKLMTMETMDRVFEVGRYEDEGRCDFRALNMSKPTERIERSFDCGFFWDWSSHAGGVAYVHEALVDRETGLVFRVPNMPRGNLEEWYHVDAHMLTPGALRFTLPDAGVLMPPPRSKGALVMGWVESGGERGGEERLVHPRDLRETGNETILGVETLRWESEFTRAPVRWHGYDVLLSEKVALWSDPSTGWILKMERRVLVEMTPVQMARSQGHEVPPAPSAVGPLHEPRPVMELEYRTVDAGTARHREETLFFQELVGLIDLAPTFARPAVGVAVVALVSALSLHVFARRLASASARRAPSAA